MTITGNYYARQGSFFIAGIQFNEEELAIDIIAKVGPGGNYLEEDHTAKNFRRFFNPKIMTRESYELWEENGKKSCAQKVKEKTQWILSHHEVEPLGESTFEDLTKLLDDFYEQAKLRRM